MVLLVLSHGGLLLASNQITPGALMSFLVATQTIQRSLGQISSLFGQVMRGMTAGSRVFEVNLSLSLSLSFSVPCAYTHIHLLGFVFLL